MKKILIMMAVCMLAAPCRATSVTGLTDSQSTVLISSCAAQLASNIKTNCVSGVCSVSWTEPQGGPVVFTDPTAARATLNAQLLAIKAKILAGTATQDDLSQGFVLALQLVGL